MLTLPPLKLENRSNSSAQLFSRMASPRRIYRLSAQLKAEADGAKATTNRIRKESMPHRAEQLPLLHCTFITCKAAGSRRCAADCVAVSDSSCIADCGLVPSSPALAKDPERLDSANAVSQKHGISQPKQRKCGQLKERGRQLKVCRRLLKDRRLQSDVRIQI